MTRTLAAALMAALCIASPIARADSRDVVLQWDTRETRQAGQLSIYNRDENGTLLGMPVGCGDLDGDGFDDVVLAPFYAPSGPTNNRPSGGKLHIHFGSEGALAGRTIDAASPPETSVEVWGARTGDFLGSEVDVVDVTGDGLADILACAQNGDGFDAASGRTQAGVLYVITGRTEWESPINLSAGDTPGVIQILGAGPGDRLAFWATGGDVTGDGIKDILVSADLTSGGNSTLRGTLYVIPGGGSLPSRIDLGDSAQVRSLEITAIFGIDGGDHFGSCIASADFDRDGFDDIAVSAGVNRAGAAFTGHDQPSGGLGSGGGDGPNEDRGDAGEVYVIYGRSQWPATIQLTKSTSEAAIYYGERSGDFFGEDLHVGDVDGDGVPELAVGALLADAQGRQSSGIGYIFWGAQMARGEKLDLAVMQNTRRVTRIWAAGPNQIGADSLRLADVDADGLADVLFGSPTSSPLGRNSAGDLKVIFGDPNGLPSIVDLAAPPVSVPVYQVAPPDQGDLFTYSLTFGDVDGDGYNDMVPNAMGGDGLLNRHDTAGDAYVISGREFSARVGRGATEAPCLTRVDVSPVQDRYFAGTPGIELTLLCTSAGGVPFEEGAVAVIDGMEVPTTFVSGTELRVRLDDAPEVRNAPGTLVVQARNPRSGTSPAVLSVMLIGPSITKAKVKIDGDGLVVKITGRNFLPGATVHVADASGTELPVAATTRKSSKKLVTRLPGVAVPSGSVLTVRVANPGPAFSEPFTTRVP